VSVIGLFRVHSAVSFAAQLGPRAARLGVDEFDKTDTWGLVNKTSIDISDHLALENIVSYQRYKKDYSSDADGTPLQLLDIGSQRFPTFPVAGLANLGIAPDGFSNSASAGPRDKLKSVYRRAPAFRAAFSVISWNLRWGDSIMIRTLLDHS
jgi:iron complex outermembrane receptor protein